MIEVTPYTSWNPKFWLEIKDSVARAQERTSLRKSKRQNQQYSETLRGGPHKEHQTLQQPQLYNYNITDVSGRGPVGSQESQNMFAMFFVF